MSPAPADATLAQAIAGRFATAAPIESVTPFGDGLINDTWLAAVGAGGYVLQRINRRIFPHPERIMENLAVLSRHLAGGHDVGLVIPAPIPAADGGAFVRDQAGDVWRLLTLVPDARVLPAIETEGQAAEAGRALGVFHRLVRDLPLERLAHTLPGFHLTPAYLDRFTAVLQQGGGACHEGPLREAIRFVAARRRDAGVLEAARAAGRVPERVVHGDPKLGNILFDRPGRRALALIDLDTVQPGLALHDIGDCLRSCCNRTGEAPGGAPAATFDLGICRALLAGYADETRGFLTSAETGLIYDAARLIPFELGLRFLTDHLEGDRWFRVEHPGQNLHKALVQFALAEDVEGKEGEIRAIVSACFTEWPR